MIYRGGDPAPKHKHGDPLMGGTVVGRSRQGNTWTYTIIMPPGSPTIILYHTDHC